jgi:hypothetical protein
MHKLLPVLVLIATELTADHGSAAADLRLSAGSSGAGNAIVLVGGMGGGTGGGMGGGGGGMGGMTGGGMGGMTGGGMGGMGGAFGGMNPYGGAQGNGLGRAFGGSDPSGEAAQPAQYYWCVTPYDQCSLASSPGSLRSGASCTCSTGHRGRIK